MVLVWSSASRGSKDVFKELTLAMEQGIAVIPLRIEDIKPVGGWKYHLAATHWLDAYPLPLKRYFGLVVDRVQALLSGPKQPAMLEVSQQVLSVLNAAQCPTFEGAKVILGRIHESQIQDPVLTTLVTHSKNLVDFCLLTGIPREAECHVNSWHDMFRAVNKLQLLRAVFTEGPLSILATAIQLKRQMRHYPYWVQSVRRRYGPGIRTS